VRFAAVETGITGETEIEILAGIEEGEVVVTGPFRVLREIEDGDEVTPPKAEENDEKENAEDS
jgi:HlyD family secretion protein